MAVSQVYPYQHTGTGHTSMGAGSSLQAAGTVTLGIPKGGMWDPHKAVTVG